MKKEYLKSWLSFAITIMCTLAFAQKPGVKGGHPREDILSMKIAFITQKLSLTPEEAQQFWPLYNQYTDKLKDIRKKKRQEARDTKQNIDELSDKEVEESIDYDFNMKQQELNLQKEYNIKFKTVLPVKKVAKLYKAEEQFKLVLIDRLKNRSADAQ